MINNSRYYIVNFILNQIGLANERLFSGDPLPNEWLNLLKVALLAFFRNAQDPEYEVSLWYGEVLQRVYRIFRFREEYAQLMYGGNINLNEVRKGLEPLGNHEQLIEDFRSLQDGILDHGAQLNGVTYRDGEHPPSRGAIRYTRYAPTPAVKREDIAPRKRPRDFGEESQTDTKIQKTEQSSKDPHRDEDVVQEGANHLANVFTAVNILHPNANAPVHQDAKKLADNLTNQYFQTEEEIELAAYEDTRNRLRLVLQNPQNQDPLLLHAARWMAGRHEDQTHTFALEGPLNTIGQPGKTTSTPQNSEQEDAEDSSVMDFIEDDGVQRDPNKS